MKAVVILFSQLIPLSRWNEYLGPTIIQFVTSPLDYESTKLVLMT